MNPERLADLHARYDGLSRDAYAPDHPVTHVLELLAYAGEVSDKLADTDYVDQREYARLHAEIDRLNAELAAARPTPPTHTYDVIVWRMEDNHWFGPDGWTWCKVIDGDPDDFTPDLPHCVDVADARAQADAWLAQQNGAGR